MLDIKTLMLLYVIINVISAAAVAVIWGQNRGRFAGISFWLVDMILQAAGALLIVLRGQVPDLVSMVLANTMIQAGALILFIGLERFTRKKGWQIHNYILLAVFIAIFTYYSLVQPDLTAREIVLSAMTMIITFQSCWLLLRRVDTGMRQITSLTGIIFACYAVFSFARIIMHIIFPGQTNDFFKAGAVDALALTVYISLSVCLTISLVLMVNRRLLADVKTQEEKFTTAFHSSPYAMTLTRPSNGRIFEVNDGFVDISGYSYEEVLGKTTFDLQLWVNEEDRLAVVKELAQGRGVHAVEYQFRNKSGELLTGLFSANLITVDNEKYILSSIGDITDRKRLEAEQQRVEKLESIGTLAGGIAHNFNNILTVVLGNISLASMEATPGSQLQKSLEQAEKASLRAKDLTLQLLTFSKGGAPVKEIASLTELLKDTANSALTGSNVKCHFSIPDGLWQAEIDARQVSQVIHNLVINARQSMPAGGTIELIAENIALDKTQDPGNGMPVKAGDYIRVTITDHGSGIPKEHLEKIFDPFFTTKVNANGLGVATSFSIARQHGGHLSVESELGGGSTFYLYLPASAPNQDKKEAIKAAGKARILVMDDEQGIREIAGRMLKHLGYEDVEFSGDGAEAIKLYKAAMESGNPFGKAILDLTIAGGHGGEWTISELLKLDPAVKAIISSGYIDDPVMAQYEDYGFSGLLVKPYTIEELHKALQDVIG